MAHQDRPTDLSHAPLAAWRSLLLYRRGASMAFLRMGRRCRPRLVRPLGRLARVGSISHSRRRSDVARPLRARDDLRQECQGRFRCHDCPYCVGSSLVFVAPANAGLLVPDSHADCPRALPPGQARRAVVSSHSVSGVGEYSRLVDHRPGHRRRLLVRRPVRISTGQPGSSALEPAGSRAPLFCIPSEFVRIADHPVRHRALHLSVPGGFLAAD